MQPTPRVDLNAAPLGELIIRAGDLSLPTAKKVLMDGYEPDSHHPDVYGLSVVFHQGASLDVLARAAHFPHRKISYSIKSLSAQGGNDARDIRGLRPSGRLARRG